MLSALSTDGCTFRLVYPLAILSLLKNSNGFQMAFFKYADVDPPYFYLTENEVRTASNKDGIWDKEAEQMDLLTVLAENAVQIPGQPGVVGLELEVFNMMFRHYNCK